VLNNASRYTHEDAEAAIQLNYNIPKLGEISQRAHTQFKKRLFEKYTSVKMGLRISVRGTVEHCSERGLDYRNTSTGFTYVPSFTTMLRTPAVCQFRLWDLYFAFPFTLRKLLGNPLDNGQSGQLTISRNHIHGTMSQVMEFLQNGLLTQLHGMRGRKCDKLLPPPVSTQSDTPHRKSGRTLSGGIISTSVTTRRAHQAMIPAITTVVFLGK
jgi:hypothetical protein